MRIVAVIQARMGSRRLPGKVLADLVGAPLLRHVIERTRAVQGVDDVVVATTAADEDEPVAAAARAWGAGVVRGCADDVLDRYHQAARAHRAGALMRITADSPMLDPEICGLVLRRFLKGDVDYASNAHPATYPDGLDTEVIRAETLARAWQEARLPSEREHVTAFVWTRPERFRLANVIHETDLSRLRWTVDEPADLTFARAVFERLARPGEGGALFGMREVLAALEREPALAQLNQGIIRNEGYVRSLALDRALHARAGHAR